MFPCLPSSCEESRFLTVPAGVFEGSGSDSRGRPHGAPAGSVTRSRRTSPFLNFQVLFFFFFLQFYGGEDAFLLPPAAPEQ